MYYSCQVVSATLDVVLNVSRVVLTRRSVAAVPGLLDNVLQSMIVFRDSSPQIFGKCCALLQILSDIDTMKRQLASEENKKKLSDIQIIVEKKKRLKDENQKRRSFQSAQVRKPLKPTNLNTPKPKVGSTLMNRPSNLELNKTVTKAVSGLNTTMVLSSTSSRKRSGSLATSPPWCEDSLPRFHADPTIAIASLNSTLYMWD